MKKLLFTLALAMGTSMTVSAQDIVEPEFVGEVLLVKADKTSELLEKSTSQNREVASTGLMITGIGKIRRQIQIDGCCAGIKFKKNEDVQFIVKNIDNNTDPMAIIQIFKFEPKKKVRRAEIASINSFGSAKSNNLTYVPFKGKKYGTSSYIITLSKKEVGEYGIVVNNPNSLDEKATIVSSFAIID
ncbi:hypothetical protein [Faecalibacter bovis]|uniref:Uncharacterized protein n=1 Tax=Faecalibacter bovis TaxID=2898187 RepID=A0ABX7XBV4_9FLAO|nr:hypothetical protein [Faecalibacter bovis]QTV05267.1 hypothetical protein J9309_10845 [Faecalibacter bovis]